MFLRYFSVYLLVTPYEEDNFHKIKKNCSYSFDCHLEDSSCITDFNIKNIKAHTLCI